MAASFVQKDDGTTHAPGKKLQGRIACSARIPYQFRFHVSRLTEQSAIVRQWEDSVLRGQIGGSGQSPQPLLESRIFFSRARGYPSAVFAVVKYAPEEEAKRQEAKRTEDTRGLDIFALPQRDWRGVSYTPLLQETQSCGDSSGFLYDPNSLDDPDMLQGKHRYLLNGKASTGPVVSSVILFVNATDLEQSLNDQFREKHPLLPPSLTLSKIRNLKKSALLGCLAIDIELATVALAIIYFERLSLQGLIGKANRRLSMAVALLLAYKFNTATLNNFANKKKLEALLDFFDKEWSLSKRQVLEAEFGGFVLLGFSLNVPYKHVYVQFTRLLKLAHKTSRMYLGDDVHESYGLDIIWLEKEREKAKDRDREGRETDRTLPENNPDDVAAQPTLPSAPAPTRPAADVVGDVSATESVSTAPLSERGLEGERVDCSTPPVNPLRTSISTIQLLPKAVTQQLYRPLNIRGLMIKKSESHNALSKQVISNSLSDESNSDVTNSIAVSSNVGLETETILSPDNHE